MSGPSIVRAPIARAWPVALVGAVLLGGVALVDPRREFLSQDDGWAYARMVEHLLETGRYRLDAWNAANMPVQIGLAAAAASLFGYSLAMLRFTTLALLVVGVVSFHRIARDFGATRGSATALSLALVASPLVFLLSLTFMSDVQFLGWMLLSLRLYLRGLRRVSGRWLFAASAAAAAAIGTRQFGVALVVGVAAALFVDARTRRDPRAWLCALALPLAAAIVQVRVGLEVPNFTQSARLQEQAWFLARPAASLAVEAGWRVAVIGQYVGLLVLPALPSIAWATIAAWALRRRSTTLAVIALIALVAVASYAALRAGSPLTERAPGVRALPLPWMMPNVFWHPAGLLKGMAIAAFASSLLWLGAAASTATGLSSRGRGPGRVLMAGTALALLALHLAYVQLNDTYLVAFVPFALLVVVDVERRVGASAVAAAATVVAAAAIVVALAAWTRGDYAQQEARWKAGDAVVRRGVAPACVGGSKHWSEYHGAFDDWIAATYPDYDPRRGDRPPAIVGDLHEPFYAWLTARAGRGRDLVLDDDQPVPPGWRVVAREPYRDSLFRRRFVVTVERDATDPYLDPSCR